MHQSPDQFTDTYEYSANQDARQEIDPATTANDLSTHWRPSTISRLAPTADQGASATLKGRTQTHCDPLFHTLKPHPKDRDWYFDEFLSLPFNLRRRVVSKLLPLFLEGEKRKRKRQPGFLTATRAMACVVVANALKATAFTRSQRVYYSRNEGHYSDDLKGIDYPKFMGSISLLILIDQMVISGWLEGRIAKAGPRIDRPKGSPFFAERSTFKPTEKFLRACLELGISHRMTIILDDAPLLILRDEDKRPVAYDLKSKRRERAKVHRVNQFLEKQDIFVPGKDWEVWRLEIKDDLDVQDHLKEDGRIPDFSRKRLRRIFNNSDWKQGGRFYGAGWQIVPSKQRPGILINGSPTVELDYIGFLIRAIYHSKGMEFTDDPYEIPTIRKAVEEKGDQWLKVRPAVKRATHVLINARPETRVNSVRGIFLPAYLSKPAVFAAIEERHVLIHDKFRSGEGLYLMNREAAICQAVLTAGVKAGIPVLPIHDAFIAEARHKEWLEAQMDGAYRKEFRGFKPEISDKSLSEGSTPAHPLPSTDQSLLLVPSPPVTVPYVTTVSSASSSDRNREGVTADPAEEAFLTFEQEATSALEKQLEGDRRFKALMAQLRPAAP